VAVNGVPVEIKRLDVPESPTAIVVGVEPPEIV
jgi:hypothetical protein